MKLEVNIEEIITYYQTNFNLSNRLREGLNNRQWFLKDIAGNKIAPPIVEGGIYVEFVDNNTKLTRLNTRLNKPTPLPPLQPQPLPIARKGARRILDE